MAKHAPQTRRTFLQYTTMGLGVAVVGGPLVWWVAAPANPPQRRTPSGDILETIPPGELPSFAQKGGSKVETVYRYAVANGDTLQYIPCFCGCGNIGHRHNADCYVAERFPDGRITYTSHGAM